jgi:hypothetical protein
MEVNEGSSVNQVNDRNHAIDLTMEQAEEEYCIDPETMTKYDLIAHYVQLGGVSISL